MPTGSTAHDPPKKRLRNACDMCYKRKGDSAEKSDHRCTNCVVARIQCTHGRTQIRATPRDSKTGQQHVAEILSTSKVYIPDKDPTLSHRVLVQVALYARELEQTIANLAYNDVPTSDSEENSTATEDVLSDAYFQSLTISDDSTEQGTPAVQSQRSHRFHGRSSSVEFIRSAMRYMDENNFVYTIQRPKFWMTPPWEKLLTTAPRLFFPDDDLLVSLVQLYFAHVNPIFPILHSRSFQEFIADGLHFRDPDFGAVVLAVCAVGSRFSDDPRVFTGGERVEHSCGWKWFRQIRNLRMSDSTGSTLYRLQRIALSVLYLPGLSQTEESWTLTGLGVRLAQGVGAHLRGKYNSSHYGSYRAGIILDIDLPVDMADEYWGVPQNHRFTGTPSNSEFFTAFVKLIQIYGRIQREIYPVDGSMCKPSKVLELDSELNNWVDSIPERLRWDPNQENQILLDQSAAMWMLIHRRFIPAPGKLAAKTSFPSLAICANAARSCGHVMDVQARRGRGPLHHPHLMTAVFESAIVLLINVWTVVDASKPRTAENMSRTVADVLNFVNVLKLYERRWRVAGIKGDILSALISLGKPVPVPVSTPTTAHPPESLAQQRQRRELELSAQEPSHLFALPIHTEELGQLPIYDSFEYAFNETLQSTQVEVSDRECWDTEMDGRLFGGDVSVVAQADFLPTASSSVHIPSGYSWQDWGSYLTDVNHNWGTFQN
ncbi:hypothetical protein FB45DRAFT_906599 [Roridomyces roridus]|uniref:Xylanolytic transcriptional activator regulatory domain-containing protein n=1 Tax=Roridomyces roridus TaxID=1738132 RepID=A0AAD7FPN3_9AGAR|nr:hypothetical protein FB45DRAFT_906599 [Roridomyces roridus]